MNLRFCEVEGVSVERGQAVSVCKAWIIDVRAGDNRDSDGDGVDARSL